VERRPGCRCERDPATLLAVATLLRTTHGDHEPAGVADRKGDHTIAVCLPARDEAGTVGSIVETIRIELQERVGLVDELVVVDDHSSDDTAAIARDAGATVSMPAPRSPT